MHSVGSETANRIMFNINLSMEERLKKAMGVWKRYGKKSEYLLTGEAYFAAQCWVYTHGIYKKDATGYNGDINDYVTQSRHIIGGDAGWDDMLNERASCRNCSQSWRKENIKYCVKCMNYVCMRCSTAHFENCNEPLVG